MAFIEQRGAWFRIIFKYGGQRYTHALNTQEETVAASVKGGVERTLMLLQQRALRIPEGADILSFILSGGQKDEVPRVEHQPPATETHAAPITLEQLKTQYLDTLAVGAIEENSLDTVRMHLRHFTRTLGVDLVLPTLTLGKLQEHVIKRAKDKGIRQRPLSPTTMKKEIASLRAAWNWGVQAGLLTGPFPNRGLKYPKTTEKPPFQTWKEIERQIGQGGVTDTEQKELWDCLFLTLPEIDELLAFVKQHAHQPFLYPMFCFAAHTGIRRSEMLRAKAADVDLEGGTARVHEKKRSQGKRTSRRVPLSPALVEVLRDWLAVRPCGPYLFSQPVHVFRSKKKRTEATPITRDEANDHFKRTLAGGKWQVLRGWHALRHSFISNCAAAGIDQRMLDQWVGHTTEEMRRRYCHLIPSNERQAISRVFPGERLAQPQAC